jgi:hypothetical protein
MRCIHFFQAITSLGRISLNPQMRGASNTGGRYYNQMKSYSYAASQHLLLASFEAPLIGTGNP